MKKVFLHLALTMAAFSFAQKPMITRWKTSNDQDKQIAINNTGAANYSFEKVGDATQKGTGTLAGGTKTLINLPSAGEYIVTITPTEDFALKMGYTTQDEAKELMEVTQWGDFRWDSSLSSMFTNCENLQVSATDVPDFSTVTDMSAMFYKCFSIRDIPNINSWNTSNVTDMSKTFAYADQFNGNVGGWNTSKVTNMFLMFAGYNVSVFNQDISKWDVSNVTNMQSMFRDNMAFNQDISGWNTAKVRDFSQMFSNAKAFNQNLGSWNLSSAENLSKMLASAGMSCENYSKTLMGWAENALTPRSMTLTATGLVYGDAGKVYRDKLTGEKAWTITGDVYDAACAVSLGIKESKISNLKINNPVHDILRVEDNEKVQNIEIYSLTGQLMKKFQGNSGNVSSLAKGVYIVKITTASGLHVEKMLKN